MGRENETASHASRIQSGGSARNYLSVDLPHITTSSLSEEHWKHDTLTRDGFLDVNQWYSFMAIRGVLKFELGRDVRPEYLTTTLKTREDANLQLMSKPFLKDPPFFFFKPNQVPFTM